LKPHIGFEYLPKTNAESCWQSPSARRHPRYLLIE
jgi:hypothetical protein